MDKFSDRLLADWLNNVSVSLVAASAAGPFIAWSLGILKDLPDEKTFHFLIGCVAWLIIAIVLHFAAHRMSPS